MKRMIWILPILALTITLAGCSDPNPVERPQRKSKSKQPQPPARPNVADVVARAVELREERTYAVTIKMKKRSYSLDWRDHVANELKAEYRTIIVGEKQYNDYKIGQEIDSKFDGWGFVFDGTFSSYVVSVNAKETQSEFFAIFSDGKQRKLSRAEYDEAKSQLDSTKNTYTVSAQGAVRTYVLEKPLSQMTFTRTEPLKRYYVTVEVSNLTFTLDPSKHLRNLANKHEITLEVPREIYDQSTSVFEPKPSWGSLFLSGRLSQLRGKIIKRWSQDDSNYELGTLTDGRKIVIPRKR